MQAWRPFLLCSGCLLLTVRSPPLLRTVLPYSTRRLLFVPILERSTLQQIQLLLLASKSRQQLLTRWLRPRLPPRLSPSLRLLEPLPLHLCPCHNSLTVLTPIVL